MLTLINNTKNKYSIENTYSVNCNVQLMKFSNMYDNDQNCQLMLKFSKG